MFKLKKKKKKYFIIVNPAAGRPNFIETTKIIKKYFSEKNLDFDLIETKKNKDAINIAKSIDDKIYDVVVAVGGDGTINEIINGIYGKKLTFALIPAGTVNVLAKELHIPNNINKAIDIIKNNKTKLIDLAETENRKFVLMAGIGFDAYTIYKVNLNLKKMVGKIAYIIAAIHTFFKHPPRLIKVTILPDNIIDYGYFVLISNAALYGGNYKLVPTAHIDDGFLDIAIFKERTISGLFKYLKNYLIPEKEIQNIKYYKSKEVYVESKYNVLIHTDAEIAGSLPTKFKILPKSLKVIVP